jgi:hypothetical protein
MPDDAGHGDAPPDFDLPPPDLQGLARDWITLWQSELAAMAVDREAQETWQTMLALWAGAAGAMLAAAPRERPGAGRSGGPARPAAAAGTAPAAAAPDPRDAEIERLARHVRELEARLADLERGVRNGDGGDRRGPGRRRG